VCGFGAPNVETLLAMAPDVVIACGVEKPELLEVLRRSGIRVVNAQKTAFMTSFPELFDAIREIGEATGHADEARALAARMESDLRQVDAEVDRIDGARRPRVFIEIEENPLMTASAGSFLDELITRAGGRNVARDIPGGYPRIDPEKVVEWDPEVILVAHSDRPGEATGRFRRRIGWSGVAAVRDGRIIDDVNPDLLFRPGPRLVDGVKALAARLHGN
jgi:iron complex transport system substrate-binding protein